MSAQKREHFRIIYPVAQAASLNIKQGRFVVRDISERGVKFALTPKQAQDAWLQDQRIKGTIAFLCGDQVPIEGNILRIESDFIVLVLAKPIPLKTIYDEHRLIIQKFDKATT